jgi:hypothetical protein
MLFDERGCHAFINVHAGHFQFEHETKYRTDADHCKKGMAFLSQKNDVEAGIAALGEMFGLAICWVVPSHVSAPHSAKKRMQSPAGLQIL